MKIGRNTWLSQVRVTWPHQVQIGSFCKIEPGVIFKFDGIYCEGPRIQLGDNVFIGSGTEFNIQESIKIGDDCLIASGCRLIDHNHGVGKGALFRTQQVTYSPIKIAKNVWIGANAVILEGVEIGEGSIVAAGAVVTRSIGAHELWGGIPAKKIRSL